MGNSTQTGQLIQKKHKINGFDQEETIEVENICHNFQEKWPVNDLLSGKLDSGKNIALKTKRDFGSSLENR